MSALPGIATFWVGPTLRWLDRLSLSSFLAQGHAVTLYHAGDTPAPKVPEGVTLARAEDLWPEVGTRIDAMPPAPLSDIFRVHLMRRTDLIWADTDVICLRPFQPRDGYLIGRQEGTWVNGAVMRLPRTSAALDLLWQAFHDRACVFPWLEAGHRAQIETLPPEDRQAATARLVGNAFGPMAQTHALEVTGEVGHALPMAALNPIPWWLGDLYFDPRGTLNHWVDAQTLALHLYSSRLRPLHKRRRPPVGSPLARIARQIGFDDFR
jgi:hypothetical protein